jgi:hypothetical protein
MSAAAMILLAATTAHGEEPISTVTLTASGPDRPIPVGSSFYLAGDVDGTVTRVQPILVRKGSRWLFGGDGSTCKELETKLGPLREIKGIEALSGVGTGLTTTTDSGIWAASSHDFPTEPAFVPEAWVRKKDVTGASSFKILVPPNSSFFVAGGSYCLFVFEKTTTQTSIQKALKEAVTRSEMALRACDATFEAGSKKREECKTKAEIEREARIEAELKDLSKEARADAVTRIDAVEATIADLFKTTATLRAIFNSWLTVDALDLPAKAFARSRPIPPKLPTTEAFKAKSLDVVSPEEASAALGRAIVLLLARRSSLMANPDVASGALSYLTTDKAIKVTHVQLRDPQQIFVSGVSTDAKKAPKESAALGLKPEALTLPHGEVTLRDVLEFGRGSVRLDGKYLTVKQLFEKLKPILATPTGELSNDDKKLLDSLVTSLNALDTELSRLLDASWAAAEDLKANPPVRVMEGSEEAIERDLGLWLRAAVVECKNDEIKAWQAWASCATTHSSQWWPKYEKGEGPVSKLAVTLQELRDARTRWATTDTLNVALMTYDVRPIARPYQAGAEFTQSTWLFSYVTMIIGVAMPLRTAELFNLPYAGVQVHLVPNPIDEPMWINGVRDFRRFAALELAIGTTNGPYGQDNRFRGWKNLPPIFVGAAFHVLPYTSVVFGGTILERRSSTVALETPRPFGTPYLGLNVQANIPDLVLALKGRTGTTTAIAPK